MDLDKMEYNEYRWKFNPKKIEVTQERNIKEQVIPFWGNVFQDYGRKKRIVKGYGEFFGEDAQDQYQRLYNVFALGGVSYLKLPKLSPFLAVFVSLDLVGEAGPEFLRYEFEFWEYIKKQSVLGVLKLNNYHIVKKGETLWSIACMYSDSIEDIIKLNPQIKRPEELDVGQKVILP